MSCSHFRWRARQVFAIAALHAATGCDLTDHQRHSEGGRQIAYDYELVLPEKFKRRWVQGIDSKVEEWLSTDAIISTDFGLYSGPPTCAAGSALCSISEEMIAGRPSLVGRYSHVSDEQPAHEAKPFKVFVNVQVDDRHRLRLNLFAWCANKPACDEALSHFRKVRIVRLERPGSGLVLPQSPVSPPPIPR
mgnify:CR=1 FL=1